MIKRNSGKIFKFYIKFASGSKGMTTGKRFAHVWSPCACLIKFKKNRVEFPRSRFLSWTRFTEVSLQQQRRENTTYSFGRLARRPSKLMNRPMLVPFRG